MLNQEAQPFACRHIFPDGHRCQSPTLRGTSGPEPFCYYHHNSRKPIPKREVQQRRSRCRSFLLNTADLNHRSGIQQAIGEVLQEIAAGTLDTKRAGLLLYGLQTASLTLPRDPAPSSLDPKTVQETIDHPDHGRIATEATLANTQVKGSAELMMEEIEAELAAEKLLSVTASAAPSPTSTHQDSRLCATFTGRGEVILTPPGILLLHAQVRPAPRRRRALLPRVARPDGPRRPRQSADRHPA